MNGKMSEWSATVNEWNWNGTGCALALLYYVLAGFGVCAAFTETGVLGTTILIPIDDHG